MKLKCEDCKYMFVCFYSGESICQNPKERKRIVLNFRQQHQTGKWLIERLLNALNKRIVDLEY